MSNEAIITTLLAIIGCLLIAFVGYFFKVNEAATNSIKIDIKELKDMFVRHVRDNAIHVPRKNPNYNNGG